MVKTFLFFKGGHNFTPLDLDFFRLVLFLFSLQGRPGVRSQCREGAAAEPTEGAAERTRQQRRAAHTTAAAAGPADGQMHCCFRHKTNHYKSIKTSNYTHSKSQVFVLLC